MILTPHTAAQPRFKALGDFMDLLTGLPYQGADLRQAGSGSSSIDQLPSSFASRTTLVHLAISAFTIAANSCGVAGAMSMP